MNDRVRVKPAARHAGVSERSFRELFQWALRNVRLQSGHTHIRFTDIDAHLERFCEAVTRADMIVVEIIRKVRE